MFRNLFKKNSPTYFDLINFFKKLPKDWLGELLSYLSFKDLSYLSQVNKFFSQLIPNNITANYQGEMLLSFKESNAFWKRKFLTHFYTPITRDDPNYFQLLRNAYEEKYENFSPRMRMAFFYAKEKRFAAVKAMQLTLNELGTHEKYGKSILYYLDQPTKDYFYNTLILPFFTPKPDQAHDINKQDENRVTRLCWEIRAHRDPKLIQDLISKGYRTETTKSGYSAMYFAAVNAHWPLLKLLIHNKNISLKDMSIALSETACYDNLEMMDLIIKQGADINYQQNHPVLHSACYSGHIKVVEFLLEKNVDIEQKDYNGITALLIAVKRGFFEIVELLLKQNAEINLSDNKGNTPLFLACENGHYDIAELLIGKADIRAKKNVFIKKFGYKINYTPIHIAAIHGHFKIVNLLINHGALDNDELEQKNILKISVHNKQSYIVKVLFKKYPGLNNDRNLVIDGNALLSIAAFSNDFDTVKTLEKLGADINYVNSNGSTALSNAARKQNHEILKFLLRKDADINLPEGSILKYEKVIGKTSYNIINSYLPIIKTKSQGISLPTSEKFSTQLVQYFSYYSPLFFEKDKQSIDAIIAVLTDELKKYPLLTADECQNLIKKAAKKLPNLRSTDTLILLLEEINQLIEDEKEKDVEMTVFNHYFAKNNS